jgi:hypothetical protein
MRTVSTQPKVIVLNLRTTQAGVFCFFSKVAIAASSEVIEVPVFSQLWLELENI